MKFVFFGVLSTLFCLNLSAAESTKWEQTLNKVSSSVVSIRVNAVKTFDTEGAKTTQATGFVVDAERGIILTNRHVVTPGPVTAEAVFVNSEEIDLKPIYRDPVHDFGFFQYDPKDLKFIQPISLKLNSTTAKVGDDIRVIGNDSGEHMSILSGTLARLDRSAPQYRRGSYNDFNTFYFQSSADTSGGSSGAPVINLAGEVVALNAGGNLGSSSSFFLPLFKVTRALKAIQTQKTITRGTIQATLLYQPYDQVRRLGLEQTIEEKFRQRSGGNGLLVVEKTVLNGAADGNIRPGDIIVSVSSSETNLDYVTRYEAFEIFLDEHVGQSINLKVLRQGKLIDVELEVEDLNQITPDEYIQLAGGVFNNFSYQLARQTNLATQGVFVASPGFMFSNAGIGRGAVIQSINNESVSNLDDFQRSLQTLQQDQHFTIKYVNIGTPTTPRIANVNFQTNWHFSKRCRRVDQQGIWQCQDLAWNQQIKPLAPTQVKPAKFSDKQTAKIGKSLVMVSAALPYHVDGQNFERYSGTGLVLDAETGLVLADRNTVPIKMAEVTINVAGVVEIPAQVLFVHPLHSYTLLKYDPELLNGNPLRSAPLSDKVVNAGDTLWLVGYQAIDRIVSEKINVASTEALKLPTPTIPQFTDTNINSLIVNNPPSVASGAMIDKRGKVRAWWTNFTFDRAGTQTIDRGLPIEHVINIRDQWLKQGRIDIHSLEVELAPISIASARNFGLSDKWMDELQDQQDKPQVLKISKLTAGSDAYQKLQVGDILLAIDEEVVGNFVDFHRSITKPEVTVTIWRDGKAENFVIKTKMLSNSDTEEIFLWSGALIQKPHRALAHQYGIEQNGVYVSWYWYGSPANRYKLQPLHRIIEFEGEAVTDLEQFIKLTQKHQLKNYVRIRLLDLIGRESFITLKQDRHYWPTERIFWNGNEWQNKLVK